MNAPFTASNQTLTSQERVNRMFNRQEHDRVPRHDNYWSETIERWTNEGLIGEREGAFELLQSDFWTIAGSWPPPFRGQKKTVNEDEQTHTFLDEWGATVRYWKSRSGTPEHIGFGCTDRHHWDTVYKPAYTDYEFEFNPEQVRDRYREGRSKGKWCFVTGLESIEATRRLMGDEITMISMADDPEWVAEVSRVYTNVVIQGLDQIMSTGIQPDGLWIYGDMAFNHATMCSPQMYKDLIWPDHKRLADWAHAHNMKFIFHTDGNVNGVVDLYIEAGFDCLQPLEAKAEMDIRKLCPKYGDRLAFFGNMDVMVMGSNDRDKVEHEVRSKLEAGKTTRGYIYHSDHSVPPTVSFDTYRYVIELLDQYGSYE